MATHDDRPAASGATGDRIWAGAYEDATEAVLLASLTAMASTVAGSFSPTATDLSEHQVGFVRSRLRGAFVRAGLLTSQASKDVHIVWRSA